MFTTVTLNDVTGAPVTLHRTAARRLHRAVGLIGVQPPRQVVRMRPSGHGGINDTRWTEPRLIVLDGRVFSAVSPADAYAEFRVLTKPMRETLEDGAALLKWTEAGAGGLALQALVKLHGEIEPPVEVGPNLLAYQAQFLAEDPRVYGQTETTVVGATLSQAAGGKVYPYNYPRGYNQSSGGGASGTNVGNRPTPPILRIYGRATTPRVRLVGSNPLQEIVLTGEVSPGDYLELDAAARTIKLNGSTSRLNLLSPADTSWFELPSGAWTVQLLASNFDLNARVDVISRPAYD